MSSSSHLQEKGELQAAKKAVAAALLDGNVNLVFGSPVDVSALPDYLDIVENPKDLGTVLVDLESSLQGRGPYKTAADVYNDVSLVWENCFKYNNRPEDTEIIDICRKSAKLFDREWRKAGLKPLRGQGLHGIPSYVSDDPLGDNDDNEADIEILPLRLLTQFEISSTSNPSALKPLDALAQERAAGASLSISGQQIAPSIGGATVNEPLENEQLVDWAVEYNEPNIIIWAVTDNAWYKLLKPSDRYKDIYAASIQGVSLAREGLEELAAGEDANDVPALIAKVMSNLNIQFSQEAKDLAIAHIETKIGKRKFRKRRRRGALSGSHAKRGRGMGRVTSRSRLGVSSADVFGALAEDADGFYYEDELDAISDDDMPVDFELTEEEKSKGIAALGGIEDDRNLLKVKQRAWKGVKYWIRRSEEEQRQEAAEAAVASEERAADAARTEPPTPTCTSRLPLSCLPDILMVWDFAHAFADVLQLPPFSLTALEAALDPGPRLRNLDALAKPRPMTTNHGMILAGRHDKPTEQKKDKDNGGDGGGGVIEQSQPSLKIKLKVQHHQQQQHQQTTLEDRGDGKMVENSHQGDVLKQDISEEHPGPSPRISAPAPADAATVNNNATMAAAFSAAHEAFSAKLASKYGISADIVLSLPVLDRDSGYSALLLRDLVSSLASAAAGVLPGTATTNAGESMDPPTVANISNPDAEHPSWPERLANTVWGAPTSSPEARQAALKLAYGDYLDLTPEERLTLLVALTHAALSSDAMIAEVSSRVDQFGYLTTRRDGGAGDEMEDEGGRLAANAAGAVAVARNKAAAIAAAAAKEREQHAKDEDQNQTMMDAAEAGPGAGAAAVGAAPSTQPQPLATQNTLELNLWKQWCSAQNLGVRRPVGIDIRGRRYWALGRQSGAFTIFIETPSHCEWGWYEGECIQKVIHWLSSAPKPIRCELPLIAALRAAPVPDVRHHGNSSSNGGPGGINNSGSGSSSRHAVDGYHGLLMPLLRGEWNTRREGTIVPPPTLEQRVPLAMDVMLGSIPTWFKGDIVQRHVMAISDVLAAAQYSRDAARALLEAERLLAAENCLSEEWTDIWQGQWRRVVAGLTDIRESPLCTVALQSHVKTAPDIISRPVFMKIATETSFVLTVPAIGDTVIVLRAGLLNHLDKYMQLVGVKAVPVDVAVEDIKKERGGAEEDGDDADDKRPMDIDARDEEGSEDDGTHTEMDGEDGVETSTIMTMHQQQQQIPSQPPPLVRIGRFGRPITGPPLLSAPRLKPESVSRVKQEWDSLRHRAASMLPAERYVVRHIVYRRHLADYADLQTDEDSEMAPRAPVAWVFLRPAKFGPKHQLPMKEIVLPVAIVSGLPDYLLKVEAYVSGTRVSWQPGDRFRMFFGGKISEKTLRKVKAGGTWHKGEVVAVEPAAPSRFASLEEKEKYDPWESVVVRWDHLAEDYHDRVNPWELEIDPDEEVRKGDEARRLQQAAARAQRARASARKDPSDPECAAQMAAWAAEDAKLAVLAAQAERAALFLSIHKSKPEPEEVAFNEKAYGTTALQQHHMLLATLGGPALMAHAAAAAAMAAANAQRMGFGLGLQPQPGVVAPMAPSGGVSGGTAAMNPMTVLSATRASGFPSVVLPPGTTVLVPAAGAGAAPQSQPPTTTTTTAAATTAANSNSIQNNANAGAPTAPLLSGQQVPDCILERLRKLNTAQFTVLLTNFYMGLKGKFKVPIFAHKELDLHAVWWAVMERGGYETVTQNKQWRDICRAIPGLDLSGQTSASYNMRQNYEKCLLDFENYAACGQYEEDIEAGKAPVHTHLTDPNTVRFTIPGTSYQQQPSSTMNNNIAQEQPTSAPGSLHALTIPQQQEQQQQQENVVVPSSSLGATLRASGAGAVGKVVQRYWAEEGGWWPAQVTAYNAETQQHQLTYNKDKPDESFEWINLGELSDAEFRIMMVAPHQE